MGKLAQGVFVMLHSRDKGKLKKKNIESVSMLIPSGGWGVESSSQRSHLLRFFLNAPNLLGWL